jgi:hypothetical protein
LSIEIRHDQKHFSNHRLFLPFYAFLGVAATLIGAVAGNIDLTPYEIGLMITFQNLGS